MRKWYPVLLFFFSLCSVAAFAGPGDTVVIKGHDNVVIQTDPSVGETRYSCWSKFPAAGAFPYRRVMAYLTFECAPGLACGEWDYINNIYLQRTGGVTGDSLGYELGKFITPYGFYWSSADSWKHGWWLDVTEWGYLLHDSVEIVYRHSGYEAKADRGWKINLSYHIVEGTPLREHKGMTPLWNKFYTYGDPAQPFNDSVAAQTITWGAGTETALLWVVQSGHGADKTDGCGEFCAKTRTIRMDGVSLDRKLMWRECGNNSVYPQAGTWILDRANWCPGATVIPDKINFSGLTPGSGSVLDLEMESYTASGSFGGYDIHSYLFEYGRINADADATLDQILTPSREYELNRFNPRCGEPLIVIRNSGAKTLTSLKINYGLRGGTTYTHTWGGVLGFMETDTVWLEGHSWKLSSPAVFEVTLSEPNGAADEFPYDNKGASVMDPVPVLPAGFVVELKTTKAFNETGYMIINAANGRVAYSRLASSFGSQGTYRDTVSLDTGTCYILALSDYGTPLAGGIDVNSDGLNFWYWDNLARSYPAYIASIDNEDGTFRFLNYGSGTLLKDFTNTYKTSRATISRADFGGGLSFSFVTSGANPVGIETVQPELRFNVYPNPSKDGRFHITYDPGTVADAGIQVTDIVGKVIRTVPVTGIKGELELNLEGAAKGIYLVRFGNAGQYITRKLICQ